MVSRGRLFDVLDHPGFIAEEDGVCIGYATYRLGEDGLEVTVIESLSRESGVGSALLAACVNLAFESRASRAWLVTTNDNLDALRFYQRRGFEMVALHRGSLTEARRTLKPEIPEVGDDGIAVRDEIELELPRSAWEGFVARYGW
jgi:GNAT superfamily N-acetyltransferase